MWYIYEINGIAKYSKEQPAVPYITMDKLPCVPVQDGYAAVLTIDYTNNNAKYVLVEKEKTEDEITINRIAEIKDRLNVLDNVISRQTEQLYADSLLEPTYEPMKEALAEKKALREELQQLQ